MEQIGVLAFERKQSRRIPWCLPRSTEPTPYLRSCDIERCCRLFVYPSAISAVANFRDPGLNIGAHKESAEHLLSALSLQSTSGDGSEYLWSTLRRVLLEMVGARFYRSVWNLR